jgi:hypothetical protein
MEYVNFFRIKGAEDEQAAAPVAGQRAGGARPVARAVVA